MKLLQPKRLIILLTLILIGIWSMIGNVKSQIETPQSSHRPHPDRNAEYLNTIGGGTDAVYVQDNYAYIGVGMRMVVLDITDPQQPQKAAETDTLSGLVRDIVVVDTIAYVAASTGGLRVIDISTPTNPKEIANVANKGSTASITIAGNRAYLAEDWNGFQVIDISDPASPRALGHYREINAIRVIVQEDVAYVAAQANGLYIINISDPANMTEIAHLWGENATVLPAYVFDLQLIGNKALVAVDIADAAGGILTLDVTDSANPQLQEEQYTIQGRPRRMILVDQTAYVLDSTQSLLYLLDVADYINDVAAPVIKKISEIKLLGYMGNMNVTQDHVYVAARSAGLRIVDITNAPAPQEIASYEYLNNVQVVDIMGDYAYLGGANLGLAVVDISQPTNPTKISTLHSASLPEVRDIQVQNQWGYAINAWHGKLHLIDISDPQNPADVDSAAPAQGVPLRVDAVGDRAYVANGADGIWVVQRSSNRLTELAQIPVSGEVKSLDVVAQDEQTLIYAATGEAGLQIIDASDLDNPKTAGSLQMDCSCLDIQVVGAKAYLVAPNEGLFIVDVSEPANPQLLGELGTNSAGQPGRIQVLGDTAFLASDWGGVRLVDISEPTNPQQALRVSTVSSAQDVHVVGNLIYAAIYNGGLAILQDSVENPTPTPVTAIQPTNTIMPTETPSATMPPTATVSQPTDTIVPTEIPSATLAPTATAPPVGTSIPSATPENSSAPAPDDDQSDDSCDQASDFDLNDHSQARRFNGPTDKDWVRFESTADTTYRIEIQIPRGSAADVELNLYPNCDSVSIENQYNTFSPGVRQDHTASADGAVYLRLAPTGATDQDEDLRYELSIRALADEVSSRSLILLAGRYNLSDPLQSNIHHVTEQVFITFQDQGYDANDIHYLATNPSLTGYDGPATKDGLRAAILDWAAGRHMNGGALTLYIMDHGNQDVIYIDEANGERVTPAELDGWLTELEADVPANTLINVIIEACHSGSFIQGAESLSKEGRVIISSTNRDWDAYASQNGAYFSDHFLTALKSGRNLFNSFWGAKEIVGHLYPWQEPWLDANGNGVPNELADASIASQRGFSHAGTLGDQWEPYIVENQAQLTVQNQMGQLRAEVRDDQKVRTVWAVIYPPSYERPADSAGELVSGDTDATILLQHQGNNIYTASYPGFNEVGVYKVVIHATDNDELSARPKVLQVEVGHRVYLPTIQR